MSGTFPSSPAPAQIELGWIQPSRVSIAHSLKRQSRTLNAHRWTWKLVFQPLTQAQIAPIMAFCVAQRGGFDTFSYTPPLRFWPRLGAGTGSPVVNNQAGSPEELQTGTRSVVTSGWTADITGIVKAGDFLSFAGHNKVYQVSADANSDGGGGATIQIEPALMEGPAQGAVITVTPVTFTVALASDINRIVGVPRAGNLAKYPGFELEFVEAL